MHASNRASSSRAVTTCCRGAKHATKQRGRGSHQPGPLPTGRIAPGSTFTRLNAAAGGVAAADISGAHGADDGRGGPKIGRRRLRKLSYKPLVHFHERTREGDVQRHARPLEPLFGHRTELTAASRPSARCGALSGCRGTWRVPPSRGEQIKAPTISAPLRRAPVLAVMAIVPAALPETVFSIETVAVLPLYGAMIGAPKAEWTQRFMRSAAPFGLMGALTAVAIPATAQSLQAPSRACSRFVARGHGVQSLGHFILDGPVTCTSGLFRAPRSQRRPGPEGMRTALRPVAVVARHLCCNLGAACCSAHAQSAVLCCVRASAARTTRRLRCTTGRWVREAVCTIGKRARKQEGSGRRQPPRRRRRKSQTTKLMDSRKKE